MLLLFGGPHAANAQSSEASSSSSSSQSSSSSWQSQVNSILGAQGQTPTSDILRFDLVRTDLSPTLNLAGTPGTSMTAPGASGASAGANGSSAASGFSASSTSLAAGASSATNASSGPIQIDPGETIYGEIAFMQQGGQFLVTVELPLLETELNVVVAAARQNSLDVAAIHNHLIGENPRTIFVHLEGTASDAGTLATHVLNTARQSAAPIPSGFVTPQQGGSVDGISSQSVAQAIGHDARGQAAGKIIDVEADRPEEFTEMDLEVPPELGPQSDFHFQSISGSQTLAVAEFALLPTEVNPVLSSLEQNGWVVSALHNHFLAIQPALLFVHAAKLGELSIEEQNISQALDVAEQQSSSSD
jgi:hypothetical protein